MKSLHSLARAVLTLACLAAGWGAHAATPKVAVTDLSYEERVREYFRDVSASQDYNHSANRNGFQASGSSHFSLQEGTRSYIVQGELRRFTADLKGALVRGGGVSVVQARPYTGKETDQIHDIISRIRKGLYPGADYVLFGTVSDVQFSDGAMNFGNTMTYTLGLDLVVDFSLINTRNYQVVAAFSAMGSAQDVKSLSQAGDVATLNRAKVVRETSQSLAEDAYAQLIEQFPQAGRPLNSRQGQGYSSAPPAPAAEQSAVTVY